MSDNLRSRTIRALGYLGLGSAVGKVASLLTTLILARLLSPADYGLMAIAMIVITFVGFFNEVGIGSAIVQKPQLTESEVNGCFAIAMLASGVLCLGTVFASGFIADFFGNQRLKPMISVLAVAFILGAFSTVPLAFLRKEMHFKAIAAVNVCGIMVQSLVCMALAATGHGVWSLVWGFVVNSCVQTVGYFVLSSWRPKGEYGIREAFSLVTYGLHVTTSRIFWYLYSNADKVIIGKLLGDKSLGIYDMAHSLATLPSSQITTLVTNVASPLFAQLQTDLPRLNSMILRLTRGIAYVAYPALVGMFVSSRELINFILGPKWMDILIPFGALCLMGLIKSVDPLLSQVLIGTGHAKKLSAYTALCGVMMSLAVVAGAVLDGLRGVSIVWITVYPLLSIKLLSVACRITGMKMQDYYKNLLPVLSAVIAMGAASMAVRALVMSFAFSLPFTLFVEIITGAMVYLLWIVYFDKHAVGEIREVLVGIGVPESRMNRWPFIRATAS